jgi:hypothetical protein
MAFAGPTFIALGKAAQTGSELIAELLQEKATGITGTDPHSKNGNVENGNENVENGNGNVENGNENVENGNGNVENGNGNVENINGNVENGNKKNGTQKNVKENEKNVNKEVDGHENGTGEKGEGKEINDTQENEIVNGENGGEKNKDPENGSKNTGEQGKCSTMYEVAVEIVKAFEEYKNVDLEELKNKNFETFEELQRYLFETYENHTSSFFELIDPNDKNENYKKVKGRLHFMKCNEGENEKYSVYTSDKTLDKDEKFGHLKEEIQDYDKYDHIFNFKDYSILDLEFHEYSRDDNMENNFIGTETVDKVVGADEGEGVVTDEEEGAVENEGEGSVTDEDANESAVVDEEEDAVVDEDEEEGEDEEEDAVVDEDEEEGEGAVTVVDADEEEGAGAGAVEVEAAVEAAFVDEGEFTGEVTGEAAVKDESKKIEGEIKKLEGGGENSPKKTDIRLLIFNGEIADIKKYLDTFFLGSIVIQNDEFNLFLISKNIDHKEQSNNLEGDENINKTETIQEEREGEKDTRVTEEGEENGIITEVIEEKIQEENGIGTKDREELNYHENEKEGEEREGEFKSEVKGEVKGENEGEYADEEEVPVVAAVQKDSSGEVKGEGEDAVAGEGEVTVVNEGEVKGVVVDEGEVKGVVVDEGEVKGEVTGEVKGVVVDEGEVKGVVVDEGEVTGEVVDEGEVTGEVKGEAAVEGEDEVKGDPEDEIGSGEIVENEDIENEVGGEDTIKVKLKEFKQLESKFKLSLPENGNTDLDILKYNLKSMESYYNKMNELSTDIPESHFPHFEMNKAKYEIEDLQYRIKEIVKEIKIYKGSDMKTPKGYIGYGGYTTSNWIGILSGLAVIAACAFRP